ncbi:MAG: hypothetical protein KC636_23820 [Myxococcales bacterium]|nr:hypothetical protein [Myxococcales bacterium]
MYRCILLYFAGLSLLSACNSNVVIVTTTDGATTESGATGDDASATSDDESGSESGSGGTTIDSDDASTEGESDAESEVTSEAESDSEASTDATTDGPGVCGDGVVAGSEGCDDGNLDDGDGCDAACAVEPPRYLIMGATTGFWRYDLISEQWMYFKWASVPQGAWIETCRITASHEHVYGFGDARIWRTSMLDGSHEVYSLPPPLAVPSKYIGLEWAGDRLCYLGANNTEFWCLKDDAWTKYPLGAQSAYRMSWDPSTNELYVGTLAQLGFQAVNLETAEIVRTIVNATESYDEWVGAYIDGYWYVSSDSTGQVRINVDDGAVVPLNLAETTASNVNLYTGEYVYKVPTPDGVQIHIYEPAIDTVTKILTVPNDMGSYQGSIAVQRPIGW